MDRFAQNGCPEAGFYGVRDDQVHPAAKQFLKVGLEIHVSVERLGVELNDEVGEFENLLRFKMEIDFVRYVTKYKKDLTNLISYFNIKINGALAQRIFHFRHK